MARPRTIVILLLAALLLSVPFVLLYWLAFTPQGLAAVIARIPPKVGPVEMRFERVDGTLANGFGVGRFELKHERVHIIAHDVRARAAIAPLLWQTIQVRRFAARDVSIEVFQGKPSTSFWEPQYLPRFLRISAEDVRVAHAALIVPNGFPLDFNRVHAAGVLRHKSIRIFSGEVEWLGMQLAANGVLRAADPMRINATVRGQGTLREGLRWVADLSGSGDLDRLEFEANVVEPLSATVKGRGETLTGDWKFAANVLFSQFDIAEFGGGGALGLIDGALDVEYDAESLGAKGAVEPAGLAAGRFDLEFDGKYDGSTLAIRRAFTRHQASRASLSAAGRIDFRDDGPWLDLTGQWGEFRWPLDDADAAITSASGKYRLRGALPFEVVASGNVRVAELAPFDVATEGTLAADGFETPKLTVAGYGGRAALNGLVTWKPDESWRLAGRITDLDTGQLRADAPGRLSFDVDARGTGFGAEASLDLRVARLAGTLRGAPASGGGRVQKSGETYAFEGVDVRLGSARARLDGRLAPDARSLRFDLAAGDLGLVSPGAKGRVTARGTLTGSAASPIVDASFSGSGIDYGALDVAQLDGRIDFDGRSGKDLGVTLNAKGLTAAGRLVDTFDLTASGSTDEHAVRLAATSGNISITARGSGAYAEGDAAWSLRFDAFDLANAAKDTLRLVEPSTLTLAANRVELTNTCLRGKDANVCAAGKRDAERWAATLSALDLPISVLTAGLTEGVTYEGQIDARADLGARHAEPWQGTLRVELQDAKTRRRLANGREDVTVLGSGLITANATAADINLDAKLDAGNAGSLTGRARVDRAGAAWQAWPLNGSLAIETNSLGFIAVLVDAIDRSAGRMKAALTLAGTLGEPRLTGSVEMREGEFDFYQVNLPLRGVSLDAQFRDNTLALSGSATAGEGRAETSGNITWRGGEPYGTLTLRGENLRVANVPEARIFASPKLDFRIDGRRIDVSGEVLIPTARLDPADVTNAVFPSSDEQIVGETQTDPSGRFTVTTNITIVLGDHVSIDTYGLSGRLTGRLETRTDTADIARGTGELNIAEGKYLAFGRKLDIERGRLIFSNGPLADPGIDIRASRQFPDIEAGANVRGTLRAPRLTLFSDPTIPQSQILSLLIAGGSLESVQSAESGKSSNPLAIQGGAILAQQLGGYVGLEDVSLESSLNNETSLVLGKYLSPRLYVSYGVSLTEAINTLKMRYTLGDHWTVKVESGAQQSADLEYTIER